MSSQGHFEQRTEKSFDGWWTPEWVLELVRRFGPIQLDPCTEASNPTGARDFFTTQGLEHEWAPGLGYDAGREGVIWVNPPYGPALRPWSKKVVQENKRVECITGLEMFVLVPARTETDWFGRLFDASAALALFRKRIKFHHPSKPSAESPAFPNALFYFGPRECLFAEVFEPAARIVTF